MSDLMLSGYQALQLLALGPCIFVIIFLMLTSRKFSQAIVPVLFFFSLACSFCLPLLDAFYVKNYWKGALLMGESLTPALIFLLVVQFTTGAVPRFFYWTILALPLIGGGALVYATLTVEEEACVLGGHICLEPVEFRQLYNVFSAALALLLTTAVFSRVEREATMNIQIKKTMGALVFALIVLNASLLAIDLFRMSNSVVSERADIAVAVVRIGFIYLVLTSIFRVFDRSFEIDFERVPTLRPTEATERERELAEAIRNLMVKERIYRNMELSRQALAKKLAVTEHVLSRAVNMCLGQSISALISQYRVEEAQLRLAQEEVAITTIAFEVGFNSIPSFNRVFKQATGVSPSEYRQKKRAYKNGGASE